MSKQCFPAGIPVVNHYTIVTSSESQRLTTMAVTHNGIPVTNYFTQVPKHRNPRDQVLHHINLLQKPTQEYQRATTTPK